MSNEYKKMVLLLTAGTGTDLAVFYHVPVGTPQEYLDDYAWESAKQNAESFGYYPLSELPDDEEGSEYLDQYTDDIEGHFEDYDPKKHDGLRRGYDRDTWHNI